ncbi:MAG: hypothetical protein ACLRHW_17270 [Coprobacillus cateniformis]
MGLVPECMKDSKLYGIELDSITGRIAKSYTKMPILMSKDMKILIFLIHSLM